MRMSGESHASYDQYSWNADIMCMTLPFSVLFRTCAVSGTLITRGKSTKTEKIHHFFLLCSLLKRVQLFSGIFGLKEYVTPGFSWINEFKLCRHLKYTILGDSPILSIG
jgi:hypothetical protein